MLTLANRQLFTHEVENAFTQVHDALDIVGLHADRDRVAQIREQLVHQHRLALPGTAGAGHDTSVASAEP